MGLCQRVIRNFHIPYNRTFHLYFLDAKFQLLGICRCQSYPEDKLSFWFMTLLGPFWWVWGNTSSKQIQIELKFWLSGVLIVVQTALKAFWKSQIFTETALNQDLTQNLSFWSNCDAQFIPWRWPRSKIAIGLSRSAEIKAIISFRFQWKL